MSPPFQDPEASDPELVTRQLEELKLVSSLPSPTGVGLAILQLTRTDDYSMGEVTRTIASDPALTGRILKLANSASMSGLEPVRTVEQAAMRLGVMTVRNVALGFTLVSGNRKGACAAFDYEGYWSESLACAVAAQGLASELRFAVAADAFTCGLLAGVGRLALASVHPERYSAVLAEAGSTAELFALERASFELDHADLAAAMMRDWSLPETFAYAASSYERDDPLPEPPSVAASSLALLLRSAARIARTLVQGGDAAGREGWRPAELEDLREHWQLSPDAFRRLFADLAERWREWGRVLQIPTDGARVEIELGVCRAAAGALLAGEVPQRKGLRILAVDDDSVTLRLLAHHLSRDGHHVAKAANGREALALVLESNPQMIVTDWMMPEMDGLELTRAVRSTKEGSGTYMLLLTGREDESRVVEAFEAGVDEYVYKPFNPRILLARVRAGQRMIELREQVDYDRRQRARQVAEMAVMNRKLQAAAMTDVLTDLRNRRYAMRRLEQELASARRFSSHLSVIMIDIDEFKSINDQHGHDVGDAVLREVAGVLKATTRRNDVICRLGGEEFLVICPQSDLERATVTASRIRAAVESGTEAFKIDRPVTVSLGVASLHAGIRTVDELLKLADRRVYAAKDAGRNRVCSGEDEQRRSA